MTVTQLAEMTDGELLAEYELCGSQDAFSELYRRHDGNLRTMLRLNLRLSESDIEEVAQDAWQVVIEKIVELSATKSFRNFLRKIGHNRACTIHRKRKREFLFSSIMPYWMDAS